MSCGNVESVKEFIRLAGVRHLPHREELRLGKGDAGLREGGYQTEEDVVGFYNTGDRMKYWGKWGGFWGGLWGMLVGAAFLIVPGIGPVVAAGSVVDWIIATLEGAVVVGGVSALGAGLFSLGIPKNSVVKYETSIKAGKFVLVAQGTAEEVGKARDMLKTSGAEQIDSNEASTGATRAA
jgi:hypothetical protein